jgi:hypothetical protein
VAFVSAASTHHVSVDPSVFRALTLGIQRAIVAGVEMGVKVGDQLVFREWVAEDARHSGGGSYTGGWVCRQCQHVLPGGSDTGIDPSCVVLSLNNAAENEWATARLKRRLSMAERRGLPPDRFWAHEDALEKEHREVHRRLSGSPMTLGDR